MSKPILIPMFPYMAHVAALKVARLLVDAGVHLATRSGAPGPARYLVYQDRTQAHADLTLYSGTKHHHHGEVQHDDPRRFRVWGRSMLTGWCSTEQLDAWREGKGNVAIRCVAVSLDSYLSAAVNNRLPIAKPAVLVVNTEDTSRELDRLSEKCLARELELSGAEERERAALKCGCGRSYTWAEYLALEKPIACQRDPEISDQVESEDNGHPVLCWLRDCECKNTMCRPKPEGAK